MQQAKLDLIILARVAAAGARALPSTRLRQDLEPLAAANLNGAQWRQLLDERLVALGRAEQVEPGGPGATNAYRITEAGHDAVCRGLGVKRPPVWKALKNIVLPALALGLDPAAEKIRAAMGDADKLRGAILRAKHALPVTENATLTRASDALVWRQLGVESGEPLTLNKVRQLLLSRVLGHTPKQGLTALRNQLAAAAAQVPSTRPDVTRRDLARAWLAEPAAGATEPAASEIPDTPKAFAQGVQTAAKVVATDPAGAGCVGMRKVFIASVWRAFSAAQAGEPMSLPVFKERLVTAHRAGQVVLHRLDHVAGLDRDLIETSETTYLNATFHLIETPTTWLGEQNRARTDP